MNEIKIADTTLCTSAFSFKEKLELARQLEKLNVDIIELPEIVNTKTDTLLVRTVSAFVRKSTVSVAVGASQKSLDDALNALNGSGNGMIRLEVPVSPVGMEYTGHKKPAMMLEWIRTSITAIREKGLKAEFSAMDATRAEEDFLKKAIAIAEEAGASSIAVSDSAAEMLPDDFAAFAERLLAVTKLPLGVRCFDRNGLASAEAILAVRKGIACVKTGGDGVNLERFAAMIKNCGDNYGLKTGINYTELHRIMSQFKRITDTAKTDPSVTVSGTETGTIKLDAADDADAVMKAVAALGYDLSIEDQTRVYEEFRRVAAKKAIGGKELDAIVASVALQVPPTYTVENFVINSSNVLSASAQITMRHEDKLLQGISLGDGPIDAAFKAIEQIIGHHYELDDFQIQAVTEGREAMGSAIVKLRAGDGRVFSGNGISTDIIAASIKAYTSAVNKIRYEEAQA